MDAGSRAYKNHCAVFQALALSDGDNFAFLRFLFCGVGNVQPALTSFLSVQFA
jgi:hypothetical protein